MSKDLALFNFGSKEVRIVTREGEPWFVAKDVAEALGYTNPQKAVRDHCKLANSVGVNESFTPTLDPQTTLIPERDVYSLIFRSNLPAAESFADWVFEAVLPSIRKTGTYSQDRWVDFAEYCNLVRKRISSRSKTLTTVPHSARHALIIARADPAMGDAMVFGDGGALWVREDKLSTAFCMSAAKDGQVGRHHFEAVREAEEYSVLTKAEVLAKSGAQQPVNK